jgi:4-alpha-glucanotransferase
MKFSVKSHYLTGLAVPLSALRSTENSAIGEFPDLIDLGRLCQKVGVDLIQLLPINDTGLESSPYSALSAYAFHPVYLRIEDLPESNLVKQELNVFHGLYDKSKRLNFKQIVQDKFKILKSLYQQQIERVKNDTSLQNYVQFHPWVIPYSVFMDIKLKNHWAGWKNWKEHQNPTPDFLENYWNSPDHQADVLFFAWLQYHCELQMSTAVQELKKMDIALKGDIPILINEDSADAWAYPETFSLELRAGSPPEPGSPEGQNWGFPIYRWEVLAKNDYKWWKDRLLHADKFYEAYRIDHVLGFFRIWATPYKNFSANLGYFLPSFFLKLEDLQSRGFNQERIQWLSEPHLPGKLIRDQLGLEWANAVEKALIKLGQEDLYRFKPELEGERSINDLPLSPHAKNFLIQQFRNRALIKVSDSQWTPSWTYYNSTAYQSLNDHEKWVFDSLAQETWKRSEELWEEQGNRLMDLMKNTTSMLVCAEDLGVIPDCVPRVLQQKHILSLRIPRWARNWNHPGQPYYPVEDYPFLSVCAPSVHDTSTLRQWWYEETDHHGFLNAIQINEALGSDYNEDVAYKVIQGLLRSNSYLCIFAIQDFFALKTDLLENDPSEERINFPGTVSEKNWSYRIKNTISYLLTRNDWTQAIQNLTSERRSRGLSQDKKETLT